MPARSRGDTAGASGPDSASPARTGTHRLQSGWGQQQRLFPDDGAEDDFFGRAVALAGETALVGAPEVFGPAGGGSGLAYVFERSAGSWRQQATLVPDDIDEDDLLGSAVAVDDGTALVGAQHDDGSSGTNAGSVYVFERSGGTWSQQAKLRHDDGGNSDDDEFGVAVAIDGETALVGAHHDDQPNGPEAGSAFVFERSGGSWSQQAKLLPGDGDARDRFGNAVDLDGTTALVGAGSDDAAYVFERSGGSWSQQAKLLPDDGDGGDQFGAAVAVAGETALVGAWSDEGPNGASEVGSASVFERSNGSWSRQATLTASTGFRGDRFGRAVALAASGTTALVGAPDASTSAAQGPGVTYVFTRDDGGWTQRAELVPTDSSSADGFGSAVAIADRTALVGVPNDDANGDDSGSAYVFASEAPDVTGDGNPARDPDGDGRYEDVNGDGDTTPGDATVLFNNVFEGNSAVTENVSLFDFNGDGSLTPGDATVLFEEVFR